MINPAIKSKLLSSADYFTAARWEGKPFAFKLKYFVANYPEMALGCFTFLFVAPVIAYYKYSTYDSHRYKALDKYRMHFSVVRDDHPNIEQIKQEKEFGREFFPKF